jgi:serine/threonine protein kinase/tetratricopeptide (TPR) repeat protein
MLKPDQILAQFKIVKRLGAGGMGEVYLAEDTKLGRNVALKLLLSDYFDDAERKERFYREAKTAAGISHPNVMAIHDINSALDPDSGRELDYIVMEYIEGTPLSGHLQKIRHDIKSVLALTEQIAAGLTAAHKVNVVHRDIKADNILIDNDNNPKILDFGLAKPVAPYKSDGGDESADTISQELTRTGKIIGTVSYMSPEQVRGEPVDTRSDIFSFGILMYRMVTGNLPFDGDTQVSTLAKILESQPEQPRLQNDQIPAEFERIIDKCLQKNPDDRYQDTRDLVVDLRNLRRQYDSSISGVTTGITDVTGLAGRRRLTKSTLKTIVPVVVVAVFLAAIFYQIFSDSGSNGGPILHASENALAILGFENKTGEDSLTWLQTGLPEILLTDLAQSQSLSIISRDRVLDCLESDSKHKTGGIFSHPECLEAAQSLGAKHALSGAYYRMGPNIRIDARMEEIATGRILLTEKVIGTDPFVLVDSLTDKIARSLNLEDSATTRASVKTFTSSSPEAYKMYLAAMEKFEKELYRESIAEFKEAISLDSTFALPYMRIAMAHVFDGRPQQGAQWFALAKQYQDRLPNWEASVLDIYANIWLDVKYDEAFAKMNLLIRNHPDDKESRYIYGLMIFAFTQDTVQTFAQMDTALQLDPSYIPVLTWFSNIHRNRGEYDKAIDYALRARQHCPDSPSPYFALATLYGRQNQFDQAIEEYVALLNQFPGNYEALSSLSGIYIHKREFKMARLYLDRVKETHADDPFIMYRYYANMSNLANWEGKFKTGMDYQFKSLEQTMLAEDSNIIALKFSGIASFYQRFRMADSAKHYSGKLYEWGSVMNRIDYPITLVSIDQSMADSARKLFDETLNGFKSIIPNDLWPLADAIEKLFNAYIEADTAALIETFLEANRVSPGSGAGNERAAGYLAALSGQYEQALELLKKHVEGQRMTSSGFVYPYVHYHLGLAEEGLGNTAQAIKHFEEMLKYWGDPEIELHEIKDARKRLARLSS